MNKLVFAAFMVAAFVALAIGGVACGDDDGDVTVEEYMKNAEQLDQEHEAAAGPIRAELDAAMADLQPDDLMPSEVAGVLTRLFDQEDEFASKIEDLDTPDEAKAIRDEVVAALQAEVTYGRDVIAGMTDATTLADLQVKFEGEDGAQIEERRSNACLSLQQLADDNNVDVDMTC
jgi:hypothetical protein